MKRKLMPFLALVCALALMGCDSVKREEYDAIAAQRDALLAENRALKDELEAVSAQRDELAADDETLQVTVGGSFFAMVRHLSPDYVWDDTTPTGAVVTGFQSEAFYVYLGEELASQVQVGGVYEFVLEEKVVEMPRARYESCPYPDFAEREIPRHGLFIKEVRPESFYTCGMNSSQITYTLGGAQ